MSEALAFLEISFSEHAAPDSAWAEQPISMASVLGPQRASKWIERAKYQWRMQTSVQARNQFMFMLQDYPCWSRMFAQEPGLHYVPLRSFLDKSLSSRERYAACAHDLSTAWGIWGEALSHQLAQGDTLPLFNHNGFTVELMRNRVSPHEGLWALQLKTPEGEGLFNMTFGFTPEYDCLVASVQGLQRASPESLAVIKKFTKAAYGMRPHVFLFACLQACCASWGVESMWGIDTLRQVKRRRNAGKQGFRFDYREFWQSQGGKQRVEDGNWELPGAPVRKSEADIASNKRSEYRKRYALMDSIASDVGARFGAAA